MKQVTYQCGNATIFWYLFRRFYSFFKYGRFGRRGDLIMTTSPLIFSHHFVSYSYACKGDDSLFSFFSSTFRFFFLLHCWNSTPRFKLIIESNEEKRFLLFAIYMKTFPTMILQLFLFVIRADMLYIYINRKIKRLIISE